MDEAPMSEEMPMLEEEVAPFRDHYAECVELETAGELMNARVGRIMRAIRAEEAMEAPDPSHLAMLRAAKARIADDRHAMRGNRPAVVQEMIAKYARLRDADPAYHD